MFHYICWPSKLHYQSPTIRCSQLYQAPLHVEGWDEALHEIGKLSNETVLSPNDTTLLLKAVANIPVLVIAGAENALVPLKSAQTMASKLVDSVSYLLLIFPCTD